MFYKALRRCAIDTKDGKAVRLRAGEVFEAPKGAFKHIGAGVLEAFAKDPRVEAAPDERAEDADDADA